MLKPVDCFCWACKVKSWIVHFLPSVHLGVETQCQNCGILLNWVFDQTPASDSIPSPFARNADCASWFSPFFSEWHCHSLNSTSLVISQMVFLSGRAVGANVWGGPSRSLGTVCGLRHPEVLKWLHVASFCVLLKHAEMRTVPGVEQRARRREEEMDDPSLVVGRFSSCPWSFHLCGAT